MAGQTTPLAFPYPTGTDRVMDGDNAMQALAEKIDDWLAPMGGTAPVNTLTSQNGWNVSNCWIIRIGPIVVLRIDATKASWGAAEGIGVVPANCIPRFNVFASIIIGSSGQSMGVYVRGGDGVLITVGAATNGAGIGGQLVYSLG